jgi:hypothetical protein
MNGTWPHGLQYTSYNENKGDIIVMEKYRYTCKKELTGLFPDIVVFMTVGLLFFNHFGKI